MIRLSGKHAYGYVVDTDINKEAWTKAQQYTLTESQDAEGDTVWILTGPDVDVCSYSWWDVRKAVEGVEADYRWIKRVVWTHSWDPNPHGLASADVLP